jgi:hypothetical protein
MPAGLLGVQGGFRRGGKLCPFMPRKPLNPNIRPLFRARRRYHAGAIFGLWMDEGFPP